MLPTKYACKQVHLWATTPFSTVHLVSSTFARILLKPFVNFYSDGQYIVAGSDDGALYVWDRQTENNVKILKGDSSIVNCLQPHPFLCLLATSGIEPIVRLWSPQPEVSTFSVLFLLFFI